MKSKKALQFDDIIIAGDDGSLYKISKVELAQYEADPTEPDFAPVLETLANGAVAGYIPAPAGARAGGDVLCYLLNLAGINTGVTKWQPNRKSGK